MSAKSSMSSAFVVSAIIWVRVEHFKIVIYLSNHEHTGIRLCDIKLKWLGLTLAVFSRYTINTTWWEIGINS